MRRKADSVTTECGGSGAVRETVGLILQAQGLWTEILKEYETAEPFAELEGVSAASSGVRTLDAPLRSPIDRCRQGCRDSNREDA